MKSMFGIEYFALSGLWVSWHCYITGLHPMLKYYALSGQTLGQFHYSPEGATYTSDGHRPSLISIPFITSPEGAKYIIDGNRPSLNNSEAVSPLANKKREL